LIVVNMNFESMFNFFNSKLYTVHTNGKILKKKGNLASNRSSEI